MKARNNQNEEASFELSKDEKAVLLQKIEIARNQIRNGECITWEELREEMETWFNTSE